MQHGTSSKIKRSSSEMFEYMDLKREKNELLDKLRKVNGRLEELVKSLDEHRTVEADESEQEQLEKALEKHISIKD